jgi:hypothetical protein
MMKRWMIAASLLLVLGLLQALVIWLVITERFAP